MTGPEQVRAKLVEIWQLTDDEAAAIFRDDRALCVAFIIHGDLDAALARRETEVLWLRSPHGGFGGLTPIEMMMAGREDEVANMLEWISGRR